MSLKCCLKGGPSDLGMKLLQIYLKKSSLYSLSLLVFIHRTPVVGRHPIIREIRDLLRPRSTPTGNKVYFYMSSSFIYTLKIHRRSFKQNRSMKTLWKMITCLLCYEIKASLVTGYSHNAFFHFWRQI